MYAYKYVCHTQSTHTSQSTTYLLFILMGLICFFQLREANNAEGMPLTFEVSTGRAFYPGSLNASGRE